MNKDILSVLQDEMQSFSKGQRRIATYIAENYDKAAFMTANRLGKEVGVSESTVVRFAMELGYSGYPDMQKAMQDMVLNRLTSMQRIGIANNRMANQDVLSMVLQADAEKIHQTNESVNRESFHAAVRAILQARRIYILGVRSAAPLANFLGYYLNYMFDAVEIVTTSGAGEMFEKLVSVTSEDVVVAFSFPRYSSATVKGVQYCRSLGAKVIGITNSNLSPIADGSDIVLTAKSDMLSLVDSLVAPLSVVNALIVSLATYREDVLTKTFDKLECVWDTYHVYEKQVDKK